MSTLEEIKQTIQDEIDPVLAMHSGSCEAVSFEEGLLTIDLKGGCVGCPARKITMLTGILPILQEKHPDIEDITLV